MSWAVLARSKACSDSAHAGHRIETAIAEPPPATASPHRRESVGSVGLLRRSSVGGAGDLARPSMDQLFMGRRRSCGRFLDRLVLAFYAEHQGRVTYALERALRSRKPACWRPPRPGSAKLALCDRARDRRARGPRWRRSAPKPCTVCKPPWRAARPSPSVPRECAPMAG